MKLLLTSAGLSCDAIIDTLLELTEKPFTELNLAFIPTAANVEEGDKFWLIEDLIRLKNLGFKQIDIVDISAVSKNIWLPRLKESDVLFVEGGNSFHLMRHMNTSGLKEVLPDLLKTRVYVGVSAGSMVMGSSNDLKMAKALWGEAIDESDTDDTLGYIDFLIRPHLDSPHFPNVNLENLNKIAQETFRTFYAIDDKTAIKVVDGEITIVSEGVWKKFN